MWSLQLSGKGSEERRLTMEVEFTARQVKISKALRTHAEEGMERIGRILGKSAHASITFSAQRHVPQCQCFHAGADCPIPRPAERADFPQSAHQPGWDLSVGRGYFPGSVFCH